MNDLATLGLRIETTQVGTGISRLDDLTKAGAKAEKQMDALALATKGLGLVMGALGSAIAAIKFGQITNDALKFKASLDEVSTLVDTTVVSMRELEKAALGQAKAFNSTPLEQTKALYQIISAGASSAAKATEILTAANKLAVGGVTDIKTAADGLTSVLNAYGSKVESAAAVSDAMFTAMRAGKTTIAELSAALGQVAPLAAQMGVSFDELTAATAALTKGGISTSVAVTGLRAILAAVAKPADEARELAKALGLEFTATALEAKGLAGFLKDLEAKTGGNTAALAKLFGGVEALVPVMALMGQAGDDLTVILGQMAEKTGATDEAFQKIADGAGYQLNLLLGELQIGLLEVAVAAAENLTPAIIETRKALEELGRSELLNAIGVGLGGAFKVVEVTVGGVIFVVGQLLRLLGATIATAAALARLDFSAVGKIGESFRKDWDAAAKSYANVLAKQLAGRKGAEDLATATAAATAATSGATRQNAAASAAAQAAADAMDNQAKKTRKSKDELDRLREAAERYLAAVSTAVAEFNLTDPQRTSREGEIQALSAEASGRRDLAEAIREQVNMLAGLQAVQATKDAKITPTGEAMTAIADSLVDAQLDELDRYVDKLQEAQDFTHIAASDMASSFGAIGEAVAGVTVAFSDYQTALGEIDAARKAANLKDPTREAENNAKAAQRSAQAQIKTYGDLASAAKGFFKEGSSGYKAMQAAELAFRAIQFAMAVKSIFFKGAEAAASVASAGTSIAAGTAETAVTVAQSGIKAAAHGVVAIARAIASLPFPLNIAAGAATAAALIGFGVKVFGGGGGGGGSTTVNPAEERRASIGTGTVLGDASAKSESIARSLEIAAENSNRDLEYSNAMLKALRSIDNKIGLLAGAVAQQIQVAGSLFDTSGLGLGTKGSSGFLGIGGSSTTRTLNDLGLMFDPASVADILNSGIDGRSYQEIQKTKTKKGFFGIGGGTKTTYETTYGSLEQDIADAIVDVVSSLRDGIVAAARVVGLEGAEAALDSFTVALGTISFEGMNGQEIEDTLNAVFSKVGDEMAGAVFPALKELQQVGEGLFETFVRVAREYQVVDTALQAMGKTFGEVGVASLAARDNLVQLFGSLDDFVEASTFFTENFLSEAERMAPIQAAVVAEFKRLGVTGVNTKEQFKQLVLGLDLTTQAGRDMYAAMLAVAPAFAKVFDFLNPEVKDAAKSVADLRRDLTEAYEREADVLQDVIDKNRAFAKSLGDYLNELTRGPAARLSPEAQFLADQANFRDVAARAQLGDPAAQDQFLKAAQAYQTSGQAYFASSGGYFNILDEIKAATAAVQATATRTADNAQSELEALKESVKGLIEINASVISVRDAITALQAALLTQTSATGSPTAPFSPLTNAAGFTAPSFTYTPPAPANTNTSATGGYTPAVNSWTDYVNAYNDLRAAADGYLAAGLIGPGTQYPTVEAWGQSHYYSTGMAEGRVGPAGAVNPYDWTQYGGYYGFASGGSFAVGGTGSGDNQNFGPVNLSPGEVVNVSRRDTMAAVVEELQALRSEVRDLRAQLARHGEAVVESDSRNTGRVVSALEASKTQLLAGNQAA